MFLRIDDILRIYRPGDNCPSHWIDRKKIVNIISFCLELKQQVVEPGENRDDVHAETGDFIKRQRIGKLPCADADLFAGIGARHLLDFCQKIVNICVDRNVLCIQVALQVAIGAVKMTINCEVCDKVVAA